MQQSKRSRLNGHLLSHNYNENKADQNRLLKILPSPSFYPSAALMQLSNSSDGLPQHLEPGGEIYLTNMLEFLDFTVLTQWSGNLTKLLQLSGQ